MHGWHRALEVHSRVNRGTPDCTGWVFALVSAVPAAAWSDRIPQDQVEAVSTRLWAREMPTDACDPRWIPCATAQGPVQALIFKLRRNSLYDTGALDESHLIEVFSRACGPCGTTLAYVMEMARSLRVRGIRDRHVERLVALVRRHALAD